MTELEADMPRIASMPRGNATGTTFITQVATVFVPVSDQDRALAFYLDKLGFEKRVDFSYGETQRCLAARTGA
jgi:hypothetical protein